MLRVVLRIWVGIFFVFKLTTEIDLLPGGKHAMQRKTYLTSRIQTGHKSVGNQILSLTHYF